MKIKYVLFDMDGLMIDSEAPTFKIWQDYFAQHGHIMPREEYVTYIGQTVARISRKLREKYPGESYVDGVHDYWIEKMTELLDNDALEAKKGLVELLDFLDEKGIKKAVTTSNTELWTKRSLECIGVFERMDKCIYSDMVKHGKPAPDIFLAGAAAFGAKPEECLVLEDSIAGIKAAHAANIPVICVPDMIVPPTEILDLCTHCCDSLLDVMQFID
ncbi:MAG: HAD family phosphatase [Oscillospiraceae bacterium]